MILWFEEYSRVTSDFNDAPHICGSTSMVAA